MCRPTFDALDRSWTAFTRSSEASAAFSRWRDDRHLDAPSLEALVQRTWQAAKPDADQTCAALARRASTDAVAARTLLQILRPGLRSLGRRLALGGSFEDVDQELVAVAWERIRTYLIETRPTTIAGNILLDVRKNYVRAVLDPDARSTSLDDVPPNQWPAAPSAEHEAIDAHLPSLRRAHAHLAAAVARGAITATSATVVWRTRIQEDSDDEVADEIGVGLRTPPTPPPAGRTGTRSRQLSDAPPCQVVDGVHGSLRGIRRRIGRGASRPTGGWSGLRSKPTNGAAGSRRRRST